jgi:CheY-like chemotaxis protein
MVLRLLQLEVRVAYDGPAALTAAQEFIPNVVLLDIGLPGMDGYEVARQLRNQSGSPQPFLVAVTGYGQAEDRQRSQAAGFDRHMVKPVDPEELKRMLSERFESTQIQKAVDEHKTTV